MERENVPENLLDWLRIPEHYLAVVTNGEVFEDNLGMFTQMREKLLSYYPEMYDSRRLQPVQREWLIPDSAITRV